MDISVVSLAQLYVIFMSLNFRLSSRLVYELLLILMLSKQKLRCNISSVAFLHALFKWFLSLLPLLPGCW